MTGLPCRAPTLVAVAISMLRCTYWRVCFWSPLLRILSTNLLAVPWYKHSGGVWGNNSNSTASECPWLARIFCVILAKSISLFAIGSDDFFQHFKAEHWKFTLHILNEHIYLSPTVCIEGNTNRLRVVSQYQTEELALFFYTFQSFLWGVGSKILR